MSNSKSTNHNQQDFRDRLSKSYYNIIRSIINISEKERNATNSNSEIWLYFLKLKNYLVEVANATRVMWPGFLFAIFGFVGFIFVPQGQDLIIKMHEPENNLSIPLAALIFWSGLTWYSCRMIAHQHFRSTKLPAVYINLSRLFGASPFIALTLAILKTEVYQDTTWEWLILIFGALLLYISSSAAIRGGLYRTEQHDKDKRWQLKPVWYFGICIAIVIGSYFLTDLGVNTKMCVMLWGIFILYLIFPIFTLFKSERPANMEYGSSIWWLKFLSIYIHKDDQKSVNFLRIWFLLGFTIYLISILSLDVSRSAGGIAIAMFSFAVLTGIFNFISTLSKKYGVSFILLLLIWAIVAGSIRDPYVVQMSDNANKPFSNRMNIDEYFEHWIVQHKTSIIGSGCYPIYFVMSNGGASRSSYWVASALGDIMDHNKGHF
ncbi:MAG: hypothetical protein JKY54_16070, partial [Flavobacteriales bacterium]|nr:hypothetical protein [Flavobacteriales bacterium]